MDGGPRWVASTAREERSKSWPLGACDSAPVLALSSVPRTNLSDGLAQTRSDVSRINSSWCSWILTRRVAATSVLQTGWGYLGELASRNPPAKSSNLVMPGESWGTRTSRIKTTRDRTTVAKQRPEASKGQRWFWGEIVSDPPYSWQLVVYSGLGERWLEEVKETRDCKAKLAQDKQSTKRKVMDDESFQHPRATLKSGVDMDI